MSKYYVEKTTLINKNTIQGGQSHFLNNFLEITFSMTLKMIFNFLLMETTCFDMASWSE